MGKVFMSFLGTNPYVEAHYRLGENISALTPFVQEALISFFCKDWDTQDRLVFFLTPEAREKNWKDGGNFTEGLETRLRKLGLSAKIEPVPFAEGYSEEEIRQNFLTVVDHLQEGDEVIFDITHSFRSLPMLNLVALSYARVLKKISILGIYYGAFEVLGYPQEVQKKVPAEERIAPVFDLTSYALLLDWSFAVEEFVRYGLAERLYDLVQGEIRPILKETRGQDTKAASLRSIAQGLKKLALNIYTSRCQAIENIRLSSDFSAEIPMDDFLPPFAPLMKSIKDKVAPFFTEDPWGKALAAAEWCLEHHLVQQGYTILEEATITEVCRLAGLKEIFNEKNRKFVSSLLMMTAQKKPPEEWQGELGRRREEALALQEKWGKPLQKLARAFDPLVNIRNDINHCGCRQGPKSAGDLLKELKEHYQAIREAVEELRNPLGRTP